MRLHTYQRTAIAFFAFFCFLTVVAYVGGDVLKVAVGKDAPFSIGSPVIASGGSIPSRYSCEGENVSPPFYLKNVPEGTQSFGVLLDDPDEKMIVGPWAHWTMWNVPSDLVTFPEGYVPPGAVQGANDFGGTGFFGPCPMEGVHTYRLVVYALDTKTLPELDKGSRREEVVKTFRRHSIEKAVLTAVYVRQYY